MSIRKPKYLEKAYMAKNKVNDWREHNSKEMFEVDGESKKVDRELSWPGRRVTCGAKKEKVELKDTSMYIESSIKMNMEKLN